MPALARTRGKPDLRISKLTEPPTAAVTGGTLRATVTTKNVGTGTANASTTKLYLSTGTARGAGDVALAPVQKVGRLRAGAAQRKALTLRVPDSAPTDTPLHVIACADATKRIREKSESNNCRVSTKTVRLQPPPSSHELIDEDVELGAIDEETGLVYKVFADFFDPRLPAKYESEPSGLADGALDEAAEQWNELTEGTQTQLRPFLIPPFYPGSYWAPDVPPARAALQAPGSGGSPWCSGSTDFQPLFNTFNFIDSADGTIRIWWLSSNTGDATTASHLMSVLENKIMPALKSLMGRGPKADGGGLCDGGSPAFDIALVDAATATTYADNSGCAATSAHMLFPRTAAGPKWAGLDPYLAHEVMHAIQYATPNGNCSANKWVREATAEWVQDYVTDPSYGIGVTPDDTEFQAANVYLNDPQVSLDVVSPPAHHDYAAYMFPFFMARKTSPTFIRSIWDQIAVGTSSVDAVDAAGGGGTSSSEGAFAKNWAAFALANWNQGPVDDYKTWDGLTTGAAAIQGPTVSTVSSSLTVTVDHLAAKYLRITPDKGVTEIKVTNELFGNPDAGVQVVVAYDDGSYDQQDISKKEEAFICIRDGTKKATDVVLIFSNANKSSQLVFAPTLEGEKVCGCPNAATVRHGSARSMDDLLAQTGGTCEATANLTYTLTESSAAPTYRFNYQVTAAVTTKMKWSREYRAYMDDGSTYTYSGSGDDWFDAGATEECPNNTAEQEWVDNGSGLYRNSQGPQGYTNDMTETFEMIAGGWWYMRQHTRRNNCTGESTTDTYEYGPTSAYPCPRESPILGWTFQKKSETADTETYSIDCGYERDINGGNPYGGPLHIAVTVTGTITVRKP